MRLKFRLSNGKKTFFQWDVNQKIILENPICTQVHFENKDISDKAYVKEVYKDNEGRSVVDIPDIFLQYTPGFLFYGYVISEDGKERYTDERGDVSVIRRAKPSDYVFTPEDQKTLEEVFDDAVKYVPEKKTDEEKANARDNIGAESVKNKVSEIGDDDGTHYPTVGAVKAELDKKIDNPQAASIGEVLTVEEVDENGKPTKWKTAPAATEQKQADWLQDNSIEGDFIKNKPFGGSLIKVGSPKVDGNGGWLHAGSMPLWTFEVAGNIIYDVPNDEMHINNALNKYGYTWKNTGQQDSLLLTFASTEDYPDLTMESLVAYNRKVGKQIGCVYLPPAIGGKSTGVIFANELNQNWISLDNTFECKLVPNEYILKTIDGEIKYPKLVVEKQIKSYDKFDFNSSGFESDLFNYAYAKENGTAGEALGLTNEDAPIYFYLYKREYNGYPPDDTYYVESATGKRFKAIKKGGKSRASWVSFTEIDTGSGSSAFYINVTSTTDDSGNTTYSADKTADEIIAAYESGAVMIGACGEFYMQGVVHIANPGELTLIFAAQELNPINGEITQRQCSVHINKDNKEMQVLYGVATKILDKGIVFMVNNNTVQTSPNSGSFDEILQTINSSMSLSKSINVILVKGGAVYNVSRLEENSNGILIKFDDVANSKTYIVFGDSHNKAFTYSEEPLSTSVNITYNEETGNLQIGG